MGIRARGCDKARVIQVVETEAIVGMGTNEDPVRTVRQYWDFNGNLLAERDQTKCCSQGRIVHNAQSTRPGRP